MKIKAEQKYIRISPRKIRLVAKAIKGLEPEKAVQYLQFVNKRPALVLKKTIKQAIANAVNNQKVGKETLRLAKIEVLEGAVYKRWRPVSRGRAHSIIKRTSHIRVILKSKAEKAKVEKEKETKKKDKVKANKKASHKLGKGGKSGAKS